MKSKTSIKPQSLQQIGTHIFVLDSVDTIKLVGTVTSEEERERTALFVSALEPGKQLVNSLDVDLELATEDDLMLTETSAEQAEVSGDETDAGELDSPYFPATDPVITITNGDIEILGGFSPTSMDDQTVAVSVDGQVGDEELAHAVRLSLREDAATTDLPVIVHVRDGIVYLHGRVPDLVDSDNAVEVAFRVLGVDEVIDLLTIIALESHGAN